MHARPLRWSLLCLALAAGPALAQDNAKPKPAAAGDDAKTEIKTVIQKVSYGIGLNIGRDLKRNGVEVDAALLAKGVADAIAGNKQALSDEEIRAAMVTLQRELADRAAKEQLTQNEGLRQQAEKNLAEGAAFLEANGKKEGVKTLASGLQFQVIKEGDGATPKASDTVRTHYSGKLLDGTEFDSSYKRGEPAKFPVTGVIPGWTETLQLMKVGSKWKLFIPAKLAYGVRGAPPHIGPNAVLVFDIELLGIEE
jgi:FKBP-type peptidyl-prolyl cis-trans isomerase FklB